MSISEEHLRPIVDDVLEPAWPVERRRASRRWMWATLIRVAAGVLGFWGLALAVSLMVGVAFPWSFYAFIGGLTAVLGLHQARDPEHLRRD
ncbi:MAG: hypothetical protein ACLQPH_01485 [Acidimicrobiales bacterium]